MLNTTKPVDGAYIPLGQRRGVSDLARIALDLTAASRTEDFKGTAPSWAYPSPPMSGSPSFPSRSTQEAEDHDQHPVEYPPANPQDAYRGTSNQQSPVDNRGFTNPNPSTPGPYQQAQPSSMSYAYQRPGEPLPGPTSFHSMAIPGMPQSQNFLPTGRPGPSTAYPVPGRPPPIENQQMSSPKSQRKSKGHVASACVPCKRAHLRCDAQRPCSRCISNGKQEACIDVQHKKRGRPRLRDDRDARYDARYPPDAMRRPLSIYPSTASMNSGYEDPLRRVQSYRVLKSQPSDPMGSRLLNRAPGQDSGVYGTPSAPTRSLNYVAFLNMKLEFARASAAFREAIGDVNVRGRNLTDVVIPADRDKVLAIRGQLNDEQMRKEPNYLPPILGRLEQIIQGLGFGPEDMKRFQLQRQDTLTFAADGQLRPFSVRISLAKEGSMYFVVLVLDAPTCYPYPPPSPMSREAPPVYATQLPTPQSAYVQQLPTPGGYDTAGHGFGDGGFGARPPPVQGQPQTNLGHGFGTPSYAASSGRLDYSGPSSYQVPRSEASPGPRLPPQPYQLPPIRPQPNQGPGPLVQPWNQEDRPSRVDIGGLIDKPATPGRPH